MPQAIRPLYEAHGVDDYYRTQADAYENPHLPEINALIERNIGRMDVSGGALDFACGGGEAAAALARLGAGRVVGCDPYTYALFEKQTGFPCLRYAFKDVIKGAELGAYSLIVSSFALHLCPEKDLFPLVWALLDAAPLLVVITPHKRPELERLPGIALLWEDFELTERGKKVRMKAYGRS